jgi:hypothetical protein
MKSVISFPAAALPEVCPHQRSRATSPWGLAAADQQIAIGRRLDWVRPVVDRRGPAMNDRIAVDEL